MYLRKQDAGDDFCLQSEKNNKLILSFDKKLNLVEKTAFVARLLTLYMELGKKIGQCFFFFS